MNRLTFVSDYFRDRTKAGHYFLLTSADIAAVFKLFTKQGVLNLISILKESMLIHFRTIVKTLSFLALFLFSILVIAIKLHIEPSDITRDYGGVYHLEPYVGFISYMGIFLWCSAFTVNFVGWRLLRHRKDFELHSTFFFWSGVITLILVFDDLFQLHELIFPLYLGVPELAFYAGYFLVIGYYSIKFYRLLVNKYMILILLSTSFLALSIVFDLLFEGIPFDTYLEDSFKLSGIALWAIYFGKYVLAELRNSIKPV